MLADLVAAVPWWAWLGALLALLAYPLCLGLARAAGRPRPRPDTPVIRLDDARRRRQP